MKLHTTYPQTNNNIQQWNDKNATAITELRAAL